MTSVPLRQRLATQGGELAPAGALVALTVTQRGWLIDGAPFTDEGAYGACAWALSFLRPGETASLLPCSTFGFVPQLLAPFVQQFEDPVRTLRGIDAALAALLTVLLYCLLRRRAGRLAAFALAAGATVGLNLPIFVDAGFKNPAFAAMAALVGGLLLASRRGTPGFAAHAGCGALLGLGACCREPFVVYGLAVLVWLLWERGLRPALVASGAALVTGLSLVALVAVWRGDPVAQLGSFVADLRAMSTMYANLAMASPPGDRWDAAGRAFVAVAWFVVPALLAGLGAAWAGGTQPFRRLGLLLLLAPLPEFLLKHSYPYTLSYGLLGAALLGVTSGVSDGRRWRLVAGAALATGLALPFVSTPYLARSLGELWQTRATAQHFARGWGVDPDASVVANSFYLSLADSLARHATAGDTLVVSGWYLNAYALTRLRPWSARNLDALVQVMAERPPTADWPPPQLVVETDRFPGFDAWQSLPAGREAYLLVDEIPAGKAHYGGFTARVYRLRPGTPARRVR